MTPDPRSASVRRGAVLPFVLLLVLGILGMAHGMLVASLRELDAARSSARHLVARASAQGAARLAARTPAGPWMDSVGRWGEHAIQVDLASEAQATATLRRLGAEAWLIEGRARPPGGAEARVATLAWALDPLERVLELAGAVSVAENAPVSVLGGIDVSAPAAVRDPLDGDDCAPWVEALTAAAGSSPLLPVARLAAHPPGSAAAEPRLGRLDVEALLRVADVLVLGAGTPEPAEAAGACLVDDPWTWGDPDRPWRPCGPHLTLRGAPEPLVVRGGVGQGVLVAGADVALRDGARFHGLVVARGRLSVEGGSVLDGMAIAAGGLHVDASASVVASSCWAVRSLAAHRERLSGLLRVPGPEWLGPL